MGDHLASIHNTSVTSAEDKCLTQSLNITRHPGLAYRTCGQDGQWLGRHLGKVRKSNRNGWTNYTKCFPVEVQELLFKVYEANEMDAVYVIAEKTRIVEVVGLTVSCICLLASLFSFTKFRSLRNNRTRIHSGLFIAMIIQVCLRQFVYLDQVISKYSNGDAFKGITTTPYVCQALYTLLEYAITSMFFWMHIEGQYLRSVVTAATMPKEIKQGRLYAICWGLPLIFTAIWATLTAKAYDNNPVQICWYGYNFKHLYWIVVSPRAVVIVVNIKRFCKIISVLLKKVRMDSTGSNMFRCLLKAVYATTALFPLLGITNALDMFEVPDQVKGSTWKFATWCYVTHALKAFQGSIVSIIFVFTNKEVKGVLRKKYDDHVALSYWRRRGPLKLVETAASLNETPNYSLTMGNICPGRRHNDPGDRIPYDRTGHGLARLQRPIVPMVLNIYYKSPTTSGEKSNEEEESSPSSPSYVELDRTATVHPLQPLNTWNSHGCVAHTSNERQEEGTSSRDLRSVEVAKSSPSSKGMHQVDKRVGICPVHGIPTNIPNPPRPRVMPIELPESLVNLETAYPYIRE